MSLYRNHCGRRSVSKLTDELGYLVGYVPRLWTEALAGSTAQARISQLPSLCIFGALHPHVSMMEISVNRSHFHYQQDIQIKNEFDFMIHSKCSTHPLR